MGFPVLFRGHGTTTPKSVDATTAVTAALAAKITRLSAIAATTTVAAALTPRQTIFSRTIAATSVASPALVKALAKGVTVVATSAVAAALVTRQTIFSRTLAASTAVTAVVTKALAKGVAIAATSSVAAALAKAFVAFVPAARGGGTWWRPRLRAPSLRAPTFFEAIRSRTRPRVVAPRHAAPVVAVRAVRLAVPFPGLARMSAPSLALLGAARVGSASRPSLRVPGTGRAAASRPAISVPDPWYAAAVAAAMAVEE